MSQEELTVIQSTFSSDEIVKPGDPNYATETLTWAKQKNLQPKLVLRPRNVESLQTAVSVLTKSKLDWNVRSQGYGSSSAKDVLLSMTAFDDFRWDAENEVVYLGAGQTWREYYRKMEEAAPDYQVVAVRLPALGVGGSTLCGGISWLSYEYGLLSDPENMLDAQIVTLDGKVKWASEEPELLWSLRGSGGGFGVVTQFKFRARKYPKQIWAGPIVIPKSALQQVAERVSAMTYKPRVPQVSFMLLALPGEALGLEAGKEYLMINAYDALGEEHARSDQGFKWAMDIPEAQVWGHSMTLREFAQAQEMISANVGKANCYGAPVMLEDKISAKTIIEAFSWFDRLRSLGPSFGQYSVLVFELFAFAQPVDATRQDLAWPRPAGASHYLLLQAGFDAGEIEQQESKAIEEIVNGPASILGSDYPRRFVPNFVETFMDVKLIYGEHYDKLKHLREKYNPGQRLPSAV